MGRERQITRDIQAKQEGEFVEASELQAETKKAIGLPHRENDEPIWLPKSQIDAMEGENGRVYCYVLTWLARRKELEMVKKY